MNTLAKWIVLIAIGLVILIDNVDATAVNLAHSQMSIDFNFKPWMIQWMINCYLISSGCLFLVGGKLGDVFGK